MQTGWVEIDQLDKLVESPVPVQSVAVVQYRYRGLSLRLVIPFVFECSVQSKFSGKAASV